MRCPCGGVITYGGRRGPLDRLTVQCHGIGARGVRAHCPHRKTYADVYEADVLAQLLACPTRRDWVPRRGRRAREAARAALDAEYERLADVYRAGIYTRARFEAELLRARPPQGRAADGQRPLGRGARPPARNCRRRCPASRRPSRTRSLRLFIDRVTIVGRRALITWRPEFAAATGLVSAWPPAD
jgi:hypothetical protein